jgi:transposase-like protein
MGPTSGSKKAGTRSDHWRDLIQQQVSSGLSVSTFCSERGLTEQSLYYWRKRLSKDTPVSFALVSADGAADRLSAPLELELTSGQRLRIPCGVDAATLRTVLAVLRERA